MSGPASTSPVAVTPPGTSRLICVASAKYSRYSEGDVIELADGRLLLALSRKAGGSDFARGEMIGMFSLDAGLTWSDEPHLICAPFGDVIDVMSASLCRSPHGLHLFFLGRGPKAQQDTRVYQMISADDGQTWSDPARISQRDAYHVVNNARVIRTSGGRMLVPAAFVVGDISKRFNQQQIFCLYSDDDGRTWRESQVISKANEPLMEPGVTECADGSIFMNIRTKLGQV
jgi:sialidase-1